MALQTGEGARFFIGPANNVANDATAYEAIDEAEWTEVGEAENFDRLGDTWTMAEFSGLKDGRVRRFKATKDGGQTTVVVGMDAGDEGQQALLAAFDSKSQFLIRVFLDDDPDDGLDSAPTTFYWRALVTGKELSGIQTSEVVRRNVVLNNNSDLLELPALNHVA